MLDPESLKAKRRRIIFRYQEQLDLIETYEEFALLENKAWDVREHEQFVQAIDIASTAPIRAVMRDWLEGNVRCNTVPRPRCEHETPAQIKLRNLAK